MFLEVGLDKVEGWIREVLATRPLPIEARLRPEGAGVGVGGKVAPLLTEFRDSLRRRVPEWLEGKNAKKCKQTKRKESKNIKAKNKLNLKPCRQMLRKHKIK